MTFDFILGLLAAIAAGLEAWRSRSFGWAAICLMCVALFLV